MIMACRAGDELLDDIEVGNLSLSTRHVDFTGTPKVSENKELHESSENSDNKLLERGTTWLLAADKWFFERSEWLFYALLVFGAVANGGFAAFYGWLAPHVLQIPILEDGNDVKLYLGLPLSTYIIIFGVIYIVLGVHCAVAVYYDEDRLKNRKRRIECVARTYAHAILVIPAIVLMAVSDQKSLFIRAFEQVYFLQFTLAMCALSMVISCRSKFFLTRPVLLIPLDTVLLGISFGAQCEVFGIIKGSSWSAGGNALLYAIGGCCLVNALYQCVRLARGVSISSTTYDIIVLVSISAIWFLSLRVSRGTAPFSPTPDSNNYRFWVFYRYGFGCGYLFFWQLRTTYVTLKRIESEEKREVAIHSRLLQMERMMAVKLLHSMVPPRIADDLSKGREVPPEMFAFATVFFSDIEGFTRYASIKTPLEVFTMLNRLFRVMDSCVGQFPRQLYKVETIGDAYMVVGGIVSFDEQDKNGDEDEDNGEQQQQQSKEADLAKQIKVVDATCQFALLVREVVQMVPFDEISFVRCRMGIHCGPIVTGVSGSAVPRFSCFGDFVNMASRMETTGTTNKIHISGVYADMVRKTNSNKTPYFLEQRAAVEIKGKGLMQTYFLEFADLDEFRKEHSKTLRKVEELLQTTEGRQWCLSDQGTLVFDGDADVLQSSNHSLSTSSRTMALNRSMLSNPAATPSSSFYSGFGFGYGNANDPEQFQPRFSFQKLSDPHFNVLKVDRDDFEGIVQAILVLIEGVVGTPGCRSVTDPGTLDRLVRRVGTHYRLVPYHNWHHAFCVVQQTAAILMRLFDGDLEADEEPPVDGKGLPIAEKDRFVLMLAALVHDVDHPGHNNAFEVRSKSSLALLYNDQNVLENHHLSLAFNIMSNASYNVFKGWSQDEAAEARKLMISCVLATDMDLHQSLQDELLRRAAMAEAYQKQQHGQICDNVTVDTHTTATNSQGGEEAFDLSMRKDLTVLYRCVLHAADVSNPTRPFRVSARISMGALQEFQKQTEDEKEAGLPITSYMVLPTFEDKAKGELFFASGIARPYFAALKACFPASSRWDPLSAIDVNSNHWREQSALTELRLPLEA